MTYSYRHALHHSLTMSNIALSPRYLIALRQNLCFASSEPFTTYFPNKSNHILGYAGFVLSKSFSNPARPGRAALGAGKEMVYIKSVIQSAVPLLFERISIHDKSGIPRPRSQKVFQIRFQGL